MKLLGYIISIAGLIGLIWTGINYINNSESFGFLGMDVAVSKGDPIPVIISAVVLIIGIILTQTSKK